MAGSGSSSASTLTDGRSGLSDSTPPASRRPPPIPRRRHPLTFPWQGIFGEFSAKNDSDSKQPSCRDHASCRAKVGRDNLASRCPFNLSQDLVISTFLLINVNEKTAKDVD